MAIRRPNTTFLSLKQSLQLLEICRLKSLRHHYRQDFSSLNNSGPDKSSSDNSTSLPLQINLHLFTRFILLCTLLCNWLDFTNSVEHSTFTHTIFSSYLIDTSIKVLSPNMGTDWVQRVLFSKVSNVKHFFANFGDL